MASPAIEILLHFYWDFSVVIFVKNQIWQLQRRTLFPALHIAIDGWVCIFYYLLFLVYTEIVELIDYICDVVLKESWKLLLHSRCSTKCLNENVLNFLSTVYVLLLFLFLYPIWVVKFSLRLKFQVLVL